MLVLLKFYWAPDVVEFVLGRFSHFYIAIAYSDSTFCHAWTRSFCEFTWKMSKFQENEHTPGLKTKFLTGNHYKTIYSLIKSECSSCKVNWGVDFSCSKQWSGEKLNGADPEIYRMNLATIFENNPFVHGWKSPRTNSVLQLFTKISLSNCLDKLFYFLKVGCFCCFFPQRINGKWGNRKFLVRNLLIGSSEEH